VTSGQATAAVRQIEHWYKQFIDTFVQEALKPTGPDAGAARRLDGSVLAHAHEQAWRHGIVQAQRSTEAADWTALTVAHEAATYEHLLGWTAATYEVDEAEIVAHQSARGYRHHPR
jgi:hypothetical protein